MKTMISVDEAINLINDHVMPLEAVTMDLKDSVGLVLAADIFSNYSIPAFPQSNMDGYAFAFIAGVVVYKLVGEVAAGRSEAYSIQKGEAVRIFTGAAIPEGADTVLMQEKAKVESGILHVLDEKLKKGDHVRSVGTEISKGVLALAKGTLLSPSSIGLLAGIGFAEVKVYPKPRIKIIVTGNELQQPGSPLGYGQVYESNSYSLRSALDQIQILQVDTIIVNDHLDELSKALQDALEVSDIVLMTGGVSVGDYDFTLKAFEQCSVTPIFHKIKQKPGKPLLFGIKDNTLVFGLPGNPGSVLTCFYEYVLLAISSLMKKDLSLKKLELPIAHSYLKSAGLTHFLKAFYDGNVVRILTGQESYKLTSYASANCLAVIPVEQTEIVAGSNIVIHILP